MAGACGGYSTALPRCCRRRKRLIARRAFEAVRRAPGIPQRGSLGGAELNLISRSLALIYLQTNTLAANPLKTLVGAQGLEPWTR
jgi:hypothetical protein